MKTIMTSKRAIHKKRYGHILYLLNINGLMNIEKISDELKQMEHKSISSNNLWNHLDKLIKLGLIVKIKKGTYCLSGKGNKLVSAYNLEKQAEELYENL